MHKYSLLFESSPWLIVLGIFLGLAYAALLYHRARKPWSKNMNYFLAAVRFVLVSLLTLLLFGPLIRQIKNTSEPPSVVFAWDNSQSVSEVEDSLGLLQFFEKTTSFEQALKEKGYTVENRSFNGVEDVLTNVRFDANSSDINELLQQIQNDYESRNLASVVLFSDGLYNLGINPSYRPFNFTINTVGMGDTVQQADINLNTVLYNKIAYQGNKFPVVAEIFSHNFQGAEMEVRVSHKGAVLESKKISVQKSNQFDRVEFFIEAKSSGMQRYKVEVAPLEGEFTLVNNSKDVFIDIIDGKEKILLVADAPHPDIKAIRSALEKNDNYEVVLYIKGINEYKPEKYDVVIWHQVPDKRQKYRELLDRAEREKTPSFFIYGSQSNPNLFNQKNGGTRIQFINRQSDEVLPVFNEDFATFKFNPEYAGILNDYPPIVVPFANFSVDPKADVLLYQKVGKINTRKPLLITHSNDNWKRAILLGEGSWRWRLHEYTENKNHNAFDDMVSKVIQYLSTKEDRRKFKTYPVKNEFLNSEPVVFETEVYNDIYEQTYGHKVQLKITNEANESRGYTYVTSENNSRYRITGLENGIYTYEATCMLNDTEVASNGVFTVKELQIEKTKLTADHNLLRNLANNNDGTFHRMDEMDDLENIMMDEELSARIYSSENFLSIINMKWGFFLLLLLITLEWFLRKYHGSY